MVTTRPARVLVVDDEEPLARLVGGYLARAGYAVRLVGDCLEAVRVARQLDPDVVVLDLGLPGLDGIEVCRQVRMFSDCYVLMLTARSDEIDKLVGLGVGADDYMTKPASNRELVARVQALLRRDRGASALRGSHPPLTFGPLAVDVAGREVRIENAETALTRTEFDILAALAGQANVVFSRRRLIDTVWGENWVGDEHLVDVHIGHLRRKLGDDPDNPRYVRTVRGIGYRMGTGQ